MLDINISEYTSEAAVNGKISLPRATCGRHPFTISWQTDSGEKKEKFLASASEPLKMRFLEGVLTSFSTLLTLSSFTSVLAHDGCMDLEEVTEISHCMEIETWEEFVSIVDDSVPGDELFFCPFDIDKGDEDPVTIEWGLKIICVFDSNTDRCNFRGYGQFLVVATGGDTLIQGLTFRDGDDYAVHVTSGGQNALEASHTFCYCRFTKISVLDVNSRGGAFMTEFGAGTVNILYCYFGSNFSMTRGAAVYARAKQVNIVGTIFADNSSLEWVRRLKVVRCRR